MYKNTRTPSFRSHTNKENMFMQLAHKKPQLPVVKKFNHETYQFADEHYQELTRKINQLDSENTMLRHLLKKSNYHQFQHVDLNRSDMHIDLKSLSDIKTNRSFENEDIRQTTLEDSKILGSARGSDVSSTQKPVKLSSLAAKQVQSQKQRTSLVHSYTQDLLLEESLAGDYQGPEVERQVGAYYKDLLTQLIHKDTRIFKELDHVIQTELGKNFKQNVDNHKQQDYFLHNLVQVMDKMIDYCNGHHPDNYFIMKTYNSMRSATIQLQKQVEKLKLFLIPMNNLQTSIYQKEQEIEKITELLQEANGQLTFAKDVILQLTKANQQMQRENQIYEENFSLLCESLVDTESESSKSNQQLNIIVQQCVDSVVQTKNSNRSGHEQMPFDSFTINKPPNKLQKQSSKQLNTQGISGLIQHLQQQYTIQKEKGNRNKMKFGQCLNRIYEIIPKSKQIAGFDGLSIVEQEQIICESLKQQE